MVLYVENFSDERHKEWCIHCGSRSAKVETNRDHVPTKSLLSKAARLRGAARDRGDGDPHNYLPQVVICKACNSGFANDEVYLLCLLHAVFAGTFYPDPGVHPAAANVLRSNRGVVRELMTLTEARADFGQKDNPFTVFADARKISRVVTKNARGHVYYEIGEPFFGDPSRVAFQALGSMDEDQLRAFEHAGDRPKSVFPEVGSRMMNRVIGADLAPGGWIDVEPGRYRYSIDWSQGVTVRTVIWDYMATETSWCDSWA